MFAFRLRKWFWLYFKEQKQSQDRGFGGERKEKCSITDLCVIRAFIAAFQFIIHLGGKHSESNSFFCFIYSVKHHTKCFCFTLTLCWRLSQRLSRLALFSLPCQGFDGSLLLVSDKVYQGAKRGDWMQGGADYLLSLSFFREETLLYRPLHCIWNKI